MLMWQAWNPSHNQTTVRKRPDEGQFRQPKKKNNVRLLSPMHAFQGNSSITQVWKNQRNSETEFCLCTERDIEERRWFVLNFTFGRDPNINDIDTDAYTVHMESHRIILTVATFFKATITKWLKQVLKFTKSTILVGVVAEVDNTRGWLRKKDPPYDMLCLTIGCHCLIYEYFDNKPASLLVSFLANPRVFTVGRDMANLCRKLKADHDIEIRNAVDVNDLAVRGLGRDDLDLSRYCQDRLAKAVLGKKMNVVRPEDELFWHEEYESFWSMNCEVVKFYTVDVYLCYLIGSELIDAIDGVADLKKKKKKKNKKDK